MKTIWYARHKLSQMCHISVSEPTLEYGFYHYDGLGERIDVRQFKALFGFTPRPGEKGRLEIKRIKNKVK